MPAAEYARHLRRSECGRDRLPTERERDPALVLALGVAVLRIRTGTPTASTADRVRRLVAVGVVLADDREHLAILGNNLHALRERAAGSVLCTRGVRCPQVLSSR